MKIYFLWFSLIIFAAACTPPQAPRAVTTSAPTVESVAAIPTIDSASAFFRMSSPAFTSGLPMPAQFSCNGQNISPALEWTEPPATAKSLVLILDDPDAPGRTWNHWLVFNIPPSSRGFAEAVPTNIQLEDGSVQGTTSAGSHGYQGPCPPSGTHRYFFKLYALDITLSLDASANKDDVEKAMDGHILASTELMGTFSR
jgi:Raf kinase inhibitor-like YbhB/YbcL family protein